MKKRGFLLIAGSIFGIVSVLHLLRSIYSVQAIMGGVEIPVWLSYVGAVIAGIMFYYSFKLADKN